MELRRILITCKTKTDAKKLRKHLIKLGIDWITGKFDSNINNEDEWLGRWSRHGKDTVYCINDISRLYFGPYDLYYKIYFDSIYNKYISYTTENFIKAFPGE